MRFGGLEDLMRQRDLRRRRKKYGRWNQLQRVLQRRRAAQPRLPDNSAPEAPMVPRPPSTPAPRPQMGQPGAAAYGQMQSQLPNQQGYGSIATGNVTPEMKRAQAQATGGGMRDLMNSGGADLPPQDGNPYSPTGGQGFNLNNMIRRRRNRWS